MKDEVLKLAAEFDKRFTSMNGVDVPEKISVPRDEWRALHSAIKQARSAPVQEPFFKFRECEDSQANVTTPPAQRTWVGLIQQERKDIWREAIGWGDPSHDDIGLMIAIEAKLKEKNT